MVGIFQALTTLADYNVMGTFNTKKRKVLLRIDQNLMCQSIARIAAGAWYESVPNQTFMHAAPVISKFWWPQKDGFVVLAL